tara:strand:- start:1087 stop:1491 length:405 start_codon:yes stop_codon:yes gene_type:complete
MVRDRPPHDSPGAGFDGSGAVDPAVAGPVLSDVSEREPVDAVGTELSLHVILVRCGQRLPSPTLPRVADAAKPDQTHQPGDPFPPDPDSETQTQFGVHPWRPVGAAGIEVNARDRGRQLRINDPPREGRRFAQS